MRLAERASIVFEANQLGKISGNPEQFDGDLTCRRAPHIASQARLP